MTAHEPDDIRWIDVLTVEPEGSHDVIGTEYAWFPRNDDETVRRDGAEKAFALLALTSPTSRVRLWSAAVVWAFDTATIDRYVEETFIHDEPDGFPDMDTHPPQRDERICRHCERSIYLVDGWWIDLNATGDDRVWRKVCDQHDTATAEHEPEE